MASRHALVIGALWVAAATAATSVGVVAVRLVADQVGDEVSAPLTSAAIRQALSSAGPGPTAEPSAEPTGSPDAGEGRVRTVTTAGGVVSARCRDAAPRLLYATPADDYRTERSTGQGAALVRFVGRTRQVTLTLTCRDDDLRVDTRTDRLGTRPASPSPVPTRPARTAEPSQRPEPSETPEPRETTSSGVNEHSSDD